MSLSTRTEPTLIQQTTTTTETKKIESNKNIPMSVIDIIKQTVIDIAPIYKKMEEERALEAWTPSTAFNLLVYVKLISEKKHILEKLAETDEHTFSEAIRLLNDDKSIPTGQLKSIITILSFVLEKNSLEKTKTLIQETYYQDKFEDNVKKCFQAMLINLASLQQKNDDTLNINQLKEEHEALIRKQHIELSETKKRNAELESTSNTSKSDYQKSYQDIQKKLTDQQNITQQKETVIKKLSTDLNSSNQVKEALDLAKTELTKQLKLLEASQELNKQHTEIIIKMTRELSQSKKVTDNQSTEIQRLKQDAVKISQLLKDANKKLADAESKNSDMQTKFDTAKLKATNLAHEKIAEFKEQITRYERIIQTQKTQLAENEKTIKSQQDKISLAEAEKKSNVANSSSFFSNKMQTDTIDEGVQKRRKR